MADEMKKLNINASNGSFSFPVVDQTARNAAQAAQTAAEEAKNEAESALDTAQSAKQVAEGITIPAALPNPNKLTFTGGATGTYDGSQPVTINIPTGGEGSSGPIQYVESLDESNLANLRDLATGTYVLYGYFYPYAGAADTLTCDNTLVSVAHLSAGSHVLVFNPLNCKVNFVEILVDESAEGGHTYSVQLIDMRDLNALIAMVGSLDNLTTEEKGTLVGAINEVAQSGGNADQSGLTAEQISALDGMFKICAYTVDASDAYAAFKTAFGITEEEPEEPDDPEVTLASISAVYSGGSVTAGTAVSELTGIVVTAHYSDGTSATVTGYTLSGTIAEGSNTITVSYSGKTTTFTVTGIANEVVTDEMSGYVMPAMPSKWSNDGDWIFGANGSVLGNLANGKTEGTSSGFVYNKPFTGTIYVREFVPATNNQANSSYGEYVIIADDTDAINNPSYDTMSCLQGEHTCKFTLDGVEQQQFIVFTDGTYEQKTGDYFNAADITDAYGVVSITKFDIPAGKVGYVCTIGTNRVYMDGWSAVFYEDVTKNPVATVAEVNE